MMLIGPDPDTNEEERNKSLDEWYISLSTKAAHLQYQKVMKEIVGKKPDNRIMDFFFENSSIEINLSPTEGQR